MSTLSLCVAVREEDAPLAECLRSSAGCFDEVIVADASGRGDTAKEAARLGAKVLPAEWREDFAAVRNLAFSKAGGDYVMWLDPGERLLPADQTRLRSLRQALPRDAGSVLMRRNTVLPSGQVSLSGWQPRLFRRAEEPCFEGEAYERPAVRGRAVCADACVTAVMREPDISPLAMEICAKRLGSGQTLSSRTMLPYARDLHISGRAGEAADLLGRFLITGDGDPEDYAEACFLMSFLRQEHGDPEGMLSVLLRSMRVMPPRAEILSRIGEYHFQKQDFAQAQWWYERALESEKPLRWAYMHHDYWDYVPLLQLCLCAWNRGDAAAAQEYNRRAGKVRPGDAAVAENNRFFATLGRDK